MPANMGVYTDFVTQAVRRYSDLGVSEFAIENEVNSPNFWDGSPQDYEVLARAGAAAVHAAAPAARVVDGSVSSAGAGYAVAKGLLDAGRDAEAVATYQAYYERRFGTRDGEGAINDVSSPAELRAELARPGPASMVAFMELINGLFDDGVFQTRQVHYYETWQALPATLAYLRSNTPTSVPLELWELGIWDDDRGVSEDQRTAEVVRATVIALAAGVQKVLWLPLLDNPTGRLVNPPRPGRRLGRRARLGQRVRPDLQGCCGRRRRGAGHQGRAGRRDLRVDHRDHGRLGHSRRGRAPGGAGCHRDHPRRGHHRLDDGPGRDDRHEAAGADHDEQPVVGTAGGRPVNDSRSALPHADTAAVDPARLVFVGGLHRSGTTPFARILGQHPDVSSLERTGVIEDEGQHLQSVYPPGTAYGGSGHFARDPRSHLTETSPLATPANAEMLLEAWTPYWDLRRVRLVEKSPPNIVMSRFLQALYPGARFVMVVRHPVTVALSTRKWTHFLSRDPRKFASLSDLVEHWLIAHRVLREDLPYLQNVRVVRYEDFVQHPQRTFEGVRAFLGLTGPIPTETVRGAASDVYQQTWASYRRSVRPGGVQRHSSRVVSARRSPPTAMTWTTSRPMRPGPPPCSADRTSRGRLRGRRWLQPAHPVTEPAKSRKAQRGHDPTVQRGHGRAPLVVAPHSYGTGVEPIGVAGHRVRRREVQGRGLDESLRHGRAQCLSDPAQLPAGSSTKSS